MWPDAVIAAIRVEDKLPNNACLLTFDDGFIDHYTTVFPRLRARGLAGVFFPVGRAIQERKVLDVHKIHFILATTRDARMLVLEIFQLLNRFRSEYDIPADDSLYKMYAAESRFDSRDVIFIKRILQRELPEVIRVELVNNLFKRHVDEDEEGFGRKLYMDVLQLRDMVRHGMEIGGHGYHHLWLETLDRSEQQMEITRTVEFLAQVLGTRPFNWAMCYPFGSYNDVAIDLLKRAGCAVGFTTRVGLVSDLSASFELHRLNTNDIPFSGDAEMCEWTRKIRG